MSTDKVLIPLCPDKELAEDSSRGFHFDGMSFFAVKKDGEVHAYQNHCPHLGIPLDMMPDTFLDADNAFIQCSTHGAIFNIHDGLCIAGPCQGDALHKLPVEIIDDMLHVDISSLENL